MTDGFKQTCLVKPIHPIKSLPLQRLDDLPGPFLANQLRFVKAVDRLRQCIVVAVAGVLPTEGSTPACMSLSL